MNRLEHQPGNETKQELIGDPVELLRQIESVDKEREYARVVGAIAARRRRRRLRRAGWGAAAAAAVVVCLLWVPGLRLSAPQPEESVRLIFADGSVAEFGQKEAENPVTDRSDVRVISRDGSLVFQKKETAAPDSVQELVYTTLVVPKRHLHDITLEDGSRIWLNSDSRLKFPVVFGSGERRVELEGEAYFEIAQDSLRPFIVEAEGQTATVLGTKFNISAYGESGSVVTALVEGLLCVATTDGSGMVVLTPGQQSNVDRLSGTLTHGQADLGGALAWKNGLINIDKMNLDEALRVVARRYDVEFDFSDPQLRDIRFRGTIPAYRSVEEVLDAIELSGPVEFRVKGSRIIVEKR